jgi:hypothetical protein
MPGQTRATCSQGGFADVGGGASSGGRFGPKLPLLPFPGFTRLLTHVQVKLLSWPEHDRLPLQRPELPICPQSFEPLQLQVLEPGSQSKLHAAGEAATSSAAHAASRADVTILRI